MTTPLSKDKPLVITGRYLFDFGEGWSLVDIYSPYKVKTEKCWYCGGKPQTDMICIICDGTGTITEKNYSFNDDQLADFLGHLLESGDEFKVTIEVTNRKPARKWKGLVHEGKDGKFLLKGKSQ